MVCLISKKCVTKESNMKITFKEILIGLIEMVAMLGIFVAVYFFSVLLCALSDKCANYYGMIDTTTKLGGM